MSFDIKFIIKLSISVCVIILCTQIGRKLPSLAGLIAVMPLTGLVVLLWLYSDNPGNYALMSAFTRGAIWGIIPSILFFSTAFFCFKKELALWIVLTASFAIWIIGAVIHQLIFHK